MFLHSGVIFALMFLSFNVETKSLHRYDNITLDYPVLSITDFPLGISDVFDDAKDVFRKVVGKMIAKKRLVGMDSRWYW